MTCQINISKWAITGLIDKKSCKNAKEKYLKEKAPKYHAQKNKL